MLGFHRRTRSLIPVKDLAKYDKVSMVEEEGDQYMDGEFEMQSTFDSNDISRQRQLILVYLIVLAEAYVHS